MGFEIQQLLGSVRGLLRDHAHRQTQRHKMTNERLTLLLQKVIEATSAPAVLLQSVLGSQETLDKLKYQLVRRLVRELGEDRFLQDYEVQTSKPRQPCRFSTGSLSRLVKDILQSLKPMELELTKLNQGFQRYLVDQRLDWGNVGPCYRVMEVGGLLRMVMESSELNLEASEDEMYFRIFILWESLAIILHKTEYLLGQLGERNQDELAGEGQPISSVSSNTKRSALSESVEIYKTSLRKREQEEVMRVLVSKPRPSNTVIRSDYQLICAPKKAKESKDRKVACCCFGK